jgi:hypothetical protein
MGLLSALRILYLDLNSLSSLPTEIGMLSHLRDMTLNGNPLRILPSEIGKLSSLTNLDIQDCSLGGTIPTTIGAIGSGMIRLDMHGNALSQSIPTELGNLVGLTTLYTYNNRLKGGLPTELARLVQLNFCQLAPQLSTSFSCGSSPNSRCFDEVSECASNSSSSGGSNSSTASAPNMDGATIGGAVGGIAAGVVIIALLVWRLRKAWRSQHSYATTTPVVRHGLAALTPLVPLHRQRPHQPQLAPPQPPQQLQPHLPPLQSQPQTTPPFVSAAYDVFLSHDWGIANCNHEKVLLVSAELQRRGLRVWVDHEQLQGGARILNAMASGIDASRLVIVLVTKNYVDKVRGQREDDNCQLEFHYACRTKSGAMIPVVMEPTMRDPSQWPGAVGMALCDVLYVDFSDFDSQRSSAERALLVDELEFEIVRHVQSL